jgi:hypothetical protein
MRKLTEREQAIMDDEWTTVEQKMKELRVLSPTLWTAEALSERFNISTPTIHRLLKTESK